MSSIQNHSVSDVNPWMTGQNIYSTFLSCSTLLDHVICALWWRVASSSSFNPDGQLLVLFRAHSTLGTTPPLPPPPPSSVPALPLCSIHPELPTPPFVAMATNAGNSPALWVKQFWQTALPCLMKDASMQINVGRPTDAGISSQLAWPHFLGLNGYWSG